MVETEAGVAGANGTRRVVALLKLLAEHSAQGLRFSQIARLSGVQGPTAHRVLKVLEEEEMVARDPVTRRYQLGALMSELGLAAAPQFSLAEICLPSLQRLAEASGDTAFLFVRRGHDALCVSRVQGSFPIQTPVVAVGSRQPLGVNAGGLALLAALPPRQQEDVITAVQQRLPGFGNLDVEHLRERLATAGEQGFVSIGGKAVPGVTAVGLAVRNPHGAPVAALTIASTSERMSPERQRELAPLLAREVAHVGQLLVR